MNTLRTSPFLELIRDFLMDNGIYDWVAYLAKSLKKSEQVVYHNLRQANEGIGEEYTKLSRVRRDEILAACAKVKKDNPVKQYFKELEASK